MKIEQRLNDALDQEAAQHDVDLHALYADTRARLDDAAPAVRSPHGRWLAPALAAACVVGVVATTAVVQDLTGDDRPGAPATTGGVEGGVDDSFSCPNLITHDWTRPHTVIDDNFVASLLGGPAAQARIHDAARYEYQEAGDRAYLRFGNADGTLATLSEFRLVDGEWARWRTDLCTGTVGSVVVPVVDELRLDRHAGTPYPADQMRQSFKGALLLDDRPFYDHVGLVRHRSIYATPCGTRLCIGFIDSETSMSSTQTRLAGTGPQDLGRLFLPADELVGRPNPYAFFVLFDTDEEVAGLRGRLADGTSVTSQAFTAPTWRGTLHALLAPAGELDEVRVVRR